MRDPDRIDAVVEALRAAWKRHPDLRLGQLVIGTWLATPIPPHATTRRDPFYIEDDVWLRILTVPEASGQ